MKLRQGATSILLQPAIIRVPRRRGVGRVGRIGAARRLRRGLAAASLDRWRLVLFAAGMLWLGEPLQTLLAGVDPGLPTSGQDGGPGCRYLRYVVGLVSLGVAASRPGESARLARAAWPLGLLLADAAASLAWSQDRLASAKALAAGAPLAAFALALCASLRPARVLQALLLALAASALGSVAAVTLVPHHAVAGVHDAVGASAPGDWRGLYGHKNTLGHVAGLAAGLLAARPGRLLAPLWLRWAAVAAALACLAGARSVSGGAIAVALPLVEPALRPRGLARLAGAGFALALAGALFAARAAVLAAGLAAAGRDATLSGRTGIWRAARELAGRRPLAGWGLDYSVSPEVARRLTALFGVNHVHSAGLDLFVNLGGIGVGLWAVAVAGALRQAVRDGAAAAGLGLAVVGWLLSGLSEDMGVRAEGPMATFGLVALLGLYALGARRGGFRRPAFGFRPAWPAPLRPPRLARRG